MKIQDILSTRVGVLLVSKVEVLGGQHRIELMEDGERDRATPIVAFDYGFLTRENADTFSNSDLSRQQVWSNGSDML